MAYMDYKGTGNIQSFRGLLADGEQQRIRIQGSVGAVAWRIVKFQVMGEEPGGATGYESIVKIYREEEASIDAVINFTDSNLLGVAMWSSSSDTKSYPDDMVAIFDREIFSRNIYITHSEIAGSANCNYYIELEEVKVSKAGMAQLAVAAARRDPSLS